MKTVVAISALENDRIGNRLDDELVLQNFDTDNYKERKTAFSTTFNNKINKKSRFDLGVDVLHLDYDIFSQTNGDEQISKEMAMGFYYNHLQIMKPN